MDSHCPHQASSGTGGGNECLAGAALGVSPPQPPPSSGTVLLLWRSCGWVWGLFAPPCWWYTAVWLGQGLALALASLWPGAAIGRSFLGLVAALVSLVLQLAMSPLALPGGAHTLTPYATMSPEHLQRLWLTASVCNALLTGVQAGGVLQAAAGYMYEASLVGAVFSGAGDSNPFLGDLIAHLPSVQGAAASGINCGFWGPVLLLLLAAVLPSASVRCCVRLGVGGRSPCTRCMALPPREAPMSNSGPPGGGWHVASSLSAASRPGVRSLQRGCGGQQAALSPLHAAVGRRSVAGISHLPLLARSGLRQQQGDGNTRQVRLPNHCRQVHRIARKKGGTSQVAVGVPASAPRRRMAQRRVSGKC